MKTQLKMILATLAILSTATSAIASSEWDATLKKQCQYMVYGNGTDDKNAAMYLAGLTTGIRSMIPKREKKIATIPTVKVEACKYALSNIGKNGFLLDYKSAVLKLSSVNPKYK
jgi:non-ribosomal peptide synthetase component E (peptide arylation enzyme)